MAGGSIIGGLIGAAIGFVVSGFNPVGAQWGWMIGSGVGAMLDGPEGEGPRLDDLRPPGSEYGRVIPIVYGTTAVSANVIWQTELEEEAHTEGDSLFSDGITTYKYYANFVIALCEGEVELGRMWAGQDRRLIWDGTTLEGGGTITFYNGSETQTQDPLMVLHDGAANVPAYRGTALVSFTRFPVENDFNTIPQIFAEVGQVSTIPASLGLASFPAQLIVTDTQAIFLIQSAFTGSHVVIRNLDATNSFEAHYDADGLGPFSFSSFSWSNGEQCIYDPDRNRLVKVQGGMYYMDLDSGAMTDVFGDNSIPEHVASGATGAGEYGRAVVYHNGLYVCLCYPGIGASTGRYTLTAVDPDTLSTVWTYTGDAADANGACGPMYALNDADPNVYLHGREGSIRKVPLSTNFTSTAWGDSATDPYSTWCFNAKVDPYTGKVWATDNSTGDHGNNYTGTPTINTYVTDLATGVTTETNRLITDSRLYKMPGYQPFCFSDTTVTVSMTASEWIWEDYILAYTPSGATMGTDFLGHYSWVAGYEIGPGFYNPNFVSELTVTPYFYLRADAMWVNCPDAASSHTCNMYPGTHAVPQDFSGIGMGDNGLLGFYLTDAGMTQNGQTLQTVVEDLCERAGLDPSEVDASDLGDDTVDGYQIAKQTTVRGAIQALQPAFYFDAVESQGVVKWVKRGGAVAATIPDDELGAYNDGGDTDDDLLRTKRQMEDELPHTISVSYVNRNADYQVLARQAQRLVGSSGDEQAIDPPIVMTDTKALEVAETNLHRAWVGRRTYAFNLPLKYTYLEPTDVISVRGYTMLLVKVTQSGGVLKCEAVFDDFNYTPHAVVTETPTSGKVVFTPSETVLELM